MEKRFGLLFLAMVSLFILTLASCGGGDGGGGGGDTPLPLPSPPEESPYRIEHGGDILPAPSGVDGRTMRVIVKNKTFQVVPGMLVRVVYNEFWAKELKEEIRVQDLITDAQGLCLFVIPRYDDKGDRLATIFLPNEPEIEVVSMTIRYVVDINLPTRAMIANANQAEITLSLGGSVKIIFVIHNAWGNPVSGVETQIIVGQKYSTNDFCVTDSNGKASFTFVAGTTSGSTVFRIQVIDYPAVMAEVIVSWTETTASIIEMVNPSKWEGSLPVAQVGVGVPADVLFLIRDNGGEPADGVQVMFTYPAAASDVSGSDGIVSVTIPASQFPGFDLDKVWAVGKKSVFLDFKIEYLKN